MLNKDSQKKAALFCVLAFLAGMVIATSGCALGTATRIGIGQHQYETGTGIYIVEKE
jgi:hypothetical protein